MLIKNMKQVFEFTEAHVCATGTPMGFHVNISLMAIVNDDTLPFTITTRSVRRNTIIIVYKS